jgi:acyl carrier protein
MSPHEIDLREPPRFRSPLEERIAEIWRHALDLERVTRDDDFYELGGTSLLAADLTMRLVEETGVDPPVSRFLAARTVADVAKLFER